MKSVLVEGGVEEEEQKGSSGAAHPTLHHSGTSSPSLEQLMEADLQIVCGKGLLSYERVHVHELEKI